MMNLRLGAKVRIDIGSKIVFGVIAESRNFQGFVDLRHKRFIEFDEPQTIDGQKNVTAATVDNDLIDLVVGDSHD